jgi:hypothetical protein
MKYRRNNLNILNNSMKAGLLKTGQSLNKEIKSLTSQLPKAIENHLTLQTSETQLKGSIT